jgi:hypothetical protein
MQDVCAVFVHGIEFLEQWFPKEKCPRASTVEDLEATAVRLPTQCYIARPCPGGRCEAGVCHTEDARGPPKTSQSMFDCLVKFGVEGRNQCPIVHNTGCSHHLPLWTAQLHVLNERDRILSLPIFRADAIQSKNLDLRVVVVHEYVWNNLPKNRFSSFPAPWGTLGVGR